MAGKWTIERRCRELNRVRNVREAGSVSLRQFWEGAQGSFLITGGTERSRAQALTERLFLGMERREPACVLTESGVLEDLLISGIGDRTGVLQVSSETYRNYHFFYGWDPVDIVRFLVQAASLTGCASPEMPVYIHGFIEILRRSFVPSLASLTALAAYDDGQIAQIGRQCGASPVSVDQVSHYAQAGVLFRMVLEETAAVFQPLTTRDCDTGCNLTALRLRSDGVYLVNIRSRFPELMHAYFAIELQRMLSRTYPPRLVLNEVPLTDADPLGKVFRTAAQGTGETGASLRNVGMLPGETESVFRTRLLLLDGGAADSELEAALRPLGTYTHYEPVPGTGGRFPFGFGMEWNLSPEPGRLRVRPSDTAGCSAVLCGGGEIILARSLR